jgi:hypothetical protein
MNAAALVPGFFLWLMLSTGSRPAPESIWETINRASSLRSVEERALGAGTTTHPMSRRGSEAGRPAWRAASTPCGARSPDWQVLPGNEQLLARPHASV